MADDNQKTPTSPPDKFDFILKTEEKPKRKLALPNMPRWAMFVIIGVLALFLLIIISSIFNGSSNTNKLLKVIASAQEITRVSDEVNIDARNPETKNIANLTSVTLNSQAQQLTAYLTSKKIKANTKKVITGLDSGIDSKLKVAASNNNYDQTYLSYLKNSLNSYQQTLNEAYKSGSRVTKPILSGSFDSNVVLLSSPQLK